MSQLGLAQASTKGGAGGGGETLRFAVAELDPPVPVQVTVTDMLLLGLTLWLPEVEPTEIPPVLVQLVAFCELQLNVELCPV